MKPLLASLSVVFALSACAPLGPNYQRPDVETPSNFKESGTWRFARPADHLPRGAWWTVFGDSTLNRLEGQAVAQNPNLRAAVLRVEQARLIARGSAAGLLPSLDANASAERSRTSANNRSNNGNNNSFSGRTDNSFRLSLDANYEIDFWGRVRRNIEATRADADAAAALAETTFLTLQADLAQNYFGLRSVQAEIELLKGTVSLRRETLQLLRDRFKGGADSGLETARSETELATAESDLFAAEKQRAELINSIAVLVGEPASTFNLTVKPLSGSPPSVPSGLPADLLQRRPDIAEAERRMAAANARIGVAKAAFYPSVSLTGRGALESADIQDVFKSGSRAWSLGPTINLPIFGQVVNRVVYERTKLAYEETVASYRGAVLSSFQEVENSLAGLRLLAQQSAAQERAVEAAERAASLSRDRLGAGLVSSLEVVDADRTRLQTKRLAQQITGQRFLTTVQLIKAIGGGWSGRK